MLQEIEDLHVPALAAFLVKETDVMFCDAISVADEIQKRYNVHQELVTALNECITLLDKEGYVPGEAITALTNAL